MDKAAAVPGPNGAGEKREAFSSGVGGQGQENQKSGKTKSGRVLFGRNKNIQGGGGGGGGDPPILVEGSASTKGITKGWITKRWWISRQL